MPKIYVILGAASHIYHIHNFAISEYVAFMIQQLTIHMVYFMKRLWKQLHHQAQIYSIEYVYKHILYCICLTMYIYDDLYIYSIRYVYKHILYRISELDDVVVFKAFSSMYFHQKIYCCPLFVFSMSFYVWSHITDWVIGGCVGAQCVVILMFLH